MLLAPAGNVPSTARNWPNYPSYVEMADQRVVMQNQIELGISWAREDNKSRILLHHQRGMNNPNPSPQGKCSRHQR